jgi:hypothetical protein
MQLLVGIDCLGGTISMIRQSLDSARKSEVLISAHKKR